MTYTEAEALHGSLMRPVDAADLIGVNRTAINDYWARNKLKKIIVTSKNGKEKPFVIVSEVNRLIKERKERNISINGNNNIVIGSNNNINIKK